MASIPQDPSKQDVSIEQPSLNRAVTPLPKEKKTTAAVQKPFGFLQNLFSRSSQSVRPLSGRVVSHEMQSLSSSKSDISNAPEEDFEIINTNEVEREMVNAANEESQKLREREIDRQLTNARQVSPDPFLRTFSKYPHKSQLAFYYDEYYRSLSIVYKTDQQALQNLQKKGSFYFIPLVNKGKEDELGIFCVESDKEVVEKWFSDKETTMQQMSDKTYEYVETSREEYGEITKQQEDALKREHLSESLLPFLVRRQ